MKKTILKHVAAASLTACLALSMAAMVGCSSSDNSSSKQSSSTSATSAASASSASKAANSAQATTSLTESDLMQGTHHAVLQFEGYEPVTITLDADAAPYSVTNFANLVNQGYYNDLNFYRIVENFCFQGGTKGNNAAGNDGSLETIPGEFAANGIENPLADSFGYGTVAMARTSNPNSASSTFFITLGDNNRVGQSLDGKYAAFGSIDPEGMEIISQIVNDYKGNVADPSSGAIANEGDQVKIESITMLD